MQSYCEIAVGSVSNRNRIIKTDDLPTVIQSSINTKEELYRSLYLYDQQILEHFQIRNTIRSFKGKYYLDKILFDIDKGNKSDDDTRGAAIYFYEQLLNEWKIPESRITISFSGTGYHFSIPNIFNFQAGKELPVVVKATIAKYFPMADNIYDGARIIRVMYTINNKSGLYKTPLSSQELYKADIHKLAESPRLDFVPISIEEEDEIPDYSDMKIYEVTKEIENVAKPVNVLNCIQTIYDIGEVKGTRHNRMLRIASAYRRSGLTYKAIVDLLSSYAPNMTRYDIELLTSTVYKKGYSYSCQDAVMSEFCDSKCIFYKHKNYAIETLDSKQLEGKFLDYVRRNDKGFDLADIYNLPHSFKFEAGEFDVLIGDTGTGKTAFVQNICVALDSLKIVYFPLEVYGLLMYRRFIQIALGMSKEEVETYYKTHENSLSASISHIKIIQVPPTLDDIQKIVIAESPDLVIIDTLDCIDIKGQVTDKLDDIGRRLKSIAQSNDTIILGIHHISKFASKEELNVHSGKGSSTIEQKADKVLALYGKSNTDLKTLRSLKNRDEKAIKAHFKADWNTFIFKQEKEKR